MKQFSDSDEKNMILGFLFYNICSVTFSRKYSQIKKNNCCFSSGILLFAASLEY